MPQLTIEQRKWIVDNSLKGLTSGQIMNMFPLLFNREAPTRKTIKNIINKFNEEGTVHNLNKSRSGRLRTARTEHNIERVQRHFDQDHETSLRKSSQELNLSKTAISNILRKDIHYFPYKFRITELLTVNAKASRVNFAEAWNQHHQNSLHNVYFSDEAFFCLIDYKNRQNDRYWHKKLDHPHPIAEQRRFPQKVMIWAVISYHGVNIAVVPNGNINTAVYINLLEQEFIPVLQRNGTINNAIFMQDGARAHTSNESLRFLRRHFANRIISNR